MLQQIKDYVEAVGMDLWCVCDLEHAFEPNTLLPNVSQKVLLGGSANITQRSDVLLAEAHLLWHGGMSGECMCFWAV